MGEFFKGWRRKIGLVMLAMACVLATGWMRSYTVQDFVYIPTAGAVISFGGSFCGLRPLDEPSPSRARWSSESVTPSTYFHPPWTTCYHKWQLQFGGFGIGEGLWGLRYSSVYFVLIPYWLLVLPLTLLSAWLILGKSRKVKPAADSWLHARDESSQ